MGPNIKKVKPAIQSNANTLASLGAEIDKIQSQPTMSLAEAEKLKKAKKN